MCGHNLKPDMRPDLRQVCVFSAPACVPVGTSGTSAASGLPRRLQYLLGLRPPGRGYKNPRDKVSYSYSYSYSYLIASAFGISRYV